MTEQQTPTPIDPADIRPGDVWEMRRRVNVQSVSLNDPELFWDELGNPWRRRDDWHLVHRPDPDAEAVEALAQVMHDDRCADECCDGCDMGDYEQDAERIMHSARERGWDVVRRAES